MIMTTIKSYTDLKQSKKLAEILPHESADMCWYLATKGNPKAMFNEGYNEYGDFELPCWSLAALLDILPKEYYPIKDHKTDLILGKPKNKWCVLYWDTTGMQHGEETLGDNPVDASYEMILRLKEKNLI
jgi:hypothetical protein